MMSRPEDNEWKAFQGWAQGKLKLNRVENILGDGMPDVIGTNCHGVGFWLELKDLADWPVRDTTCPLHKKFRPGQLPFLLDWKSWGFNTYVLLRVKKIFYLVNPIDGLDKVTKEELPRYFIKVGIKDILEYLRELK
jgi:hypothetical protein